MWGETQMSTRNTSLRSSETNRPHTHEDLNRLRGAVPVEPAVARHSLERFRSLTHEKDFVPARLTMGSVAGMSAMCMSIWQVRTGMNPDTMGDAELSPSGD